MVLPVTTADVFSFKKFNVGVIVELLGTVSVTVLDKFGSIQS